MARLWVIKYGSSLITPDASGHAAVIESVAAQVAQLQHHNVECIIVSSAAIAYGMIECGIAFEDRPKDMQQLQALAAIGQQKLIQQWHLHLSANGLHCGQVLVNSSDCVHSTAKINLLHTFDALRKNRAIAVCNENDSVATDEVRAGDNDNLASHIAVLVKAERLYLFSEIEGVLTEPPSPDQPLKPQSLVTHAYAQDPLLNTMAGHAVSSVGTGGMLSKLQAARRAARYGIDTYLGHGHNPQALIDAAHNQWNGTLLSAQPECKVQYRTLHP